MNVFTWILVAIVFCPVAIAFDTSTFDTPKSGFDAEQLITIQDTVVYNTAYISENGSSWQETPLSGDRETQNWVFTQATSDASLENIRYVAAFSCTWQQTEWSCGENWQVLDRGEQPQDSTNTSEFTPDFSLEGQMNALNDLYEATNGPSWDTRTGWPISNEQNMESAYGITTDEQGNVIQINLYNNNLEGNLPETLGNLQYLELFSVKANPLYSKIPESIQYWNNIHTLLFANQQSISQTNIPQDGRYNTHPGKRYGVSDTKYTGTIPDVFNHMPNLRFFELSWQEHMDRQPFPSTLYEHENLETLVLTGTQLSGVLEDRFNLPKLKVLFLGSTHLEGPLPSTWANSPDIVNMKVGHSNWFVKNGYMTHTFSGTLPESFAVFDDLQFFSLINQDIDGEIPGFIIENWDSLREIGLGGNNLEGTIPKEFGDKDLTTFLMHDNQFSGELHENLVRGMPNVILFSVHSNKLTGSVHPEYWRNKTRLRSVNLAQNQFTGSLPEAPEYAGDFVSYYLYRNNFTGGIPDSWQNFFTQEKLTEEPNRKDFSTIQIHGNQLEGVMPAWFSEDSVGVRPHVGANKWVHKDVLENGVDVGWTLYPNQPKPFGQEESFTVSIDDTFVFDYSHKVYETDEVQWTKDNNPLSGGEDGVLRIDNVDASDAGTYRLELTNNGVPPRGQSSGTNTVASEPILITVS